MGYRVNRAGAAWVSSGRDYTTAAGRLTPGQGLAGGNQPLKRTVWRARSSTSNVKMSGRA